MKYHATRVLAVVQNSGIHLVLDREPEDVVREGLSLNLPAAADLQSAKLMLALDIRRLAELIAVADVWTDYYGDDDEKFNNIGMNEFLDVLYRFRKYPIEQWNGAKIVELAGRHIGHAQRFQLKYPNADGRTNTQIRSTAGLMHDFIFNATSKILHADEYSVQNHVNGDPFAWFSILLAGHKVLQLYQSNALAEPI
jgi:hypothetical protein